MKHCLAIFTLLALLVTLTWANGHWPAPAGQFRPENDDMLSQWTQQNLRDWQLVETLQTTVTSPTGLAYDGQVFYAGNWNGSLSNIQKIDPNTGATIGTIPSPAQWPGGLAWDGANIWVTDYIGGMKIFKLDPNTGAILSSFPVNYCYFWGGLAWDGTNLLMGINGNPSLPIPCKIIKYSTTGTPLDSMTVPRGYISGLEYYNGHLYYSDSQNDKLFKMLWGGTLVDSTPAANGYPSGLSMQGNLLCNLDHTTRGIYKYDISGQPPQMNVDITLVPFVYPIQIPASGGSFEFYLFVTNNDSTAHTLSLWTMEIQPGGGMVGPLLGPASVALPPGTKGWYRHQNVPSTAPSGSYTYIGYAGLYPATIADSSFFNFTKLATGDGATVNDWACSGESFQADLNATPSGFSLLSNYPNPFNPSTTIGYTLLEAGFARLSVFDLSGREVAKLVNGWRDAGPHHVSFDGSALTSGVYIYSLATNGQVSSAKMILMK
jgi:hypothetical protein